MPAVFLVSDTHFGHAGVCRFLRDDGTKLRPWDNPEEMDEEMVKRWNETVRPNDKVYHLGDVVINRKSLQILERLKAITTFLNSKITLNIFVMFVVIM
jgi:calcineurin-like phosphoesterase family protein